MSRDTHHFCVGTYLSSCAEVRPHVFPAARAAWARLVGDVGMDTVFDCNSNHLWVIAFEQRVALLPSVLSGLLGQLRRMVTPRSPSC